MKVRNGKIVRYFNEQSGICAYCREEMTLSLGYPNTATVDHIIPVSKGGLRKHYKEIAACYDCNQKKRNRDIKEWLLYSVAIFAISDQSKILDRSYNR